MDDQSTFLQALREAPDDPAPGLIYADWLEEHGQAERAEFIRLSLDLVGRPPEDNKRPGLILELQDLGSRVLPGWQEELPRVRGMSWDPPRTGFFRSITVHHVGAFLKGAPEILAAAPVTTIQLDIRLEQLNPADLEALAGLADLQSIRELVIRRQGMTGTLIRPLLGSPNLTNLRRLDLWENTIGAAGTKAIAVNPQLANLASLDLQGNAIRQTGAQALASSATLVGLRDLNLRYSQIDRKGLEALVEPSGLPQLERLNLGANNLIDGDLLLLAESSLFPRLRGLNLASNRGISGRGLQHLLDTGSRFNLEELNLSGAELTGATLKMLALAPRIGGLRRLNLVGAEWTPAVAEAIARSRLREGLEILYVDSPFDLPVHSSRVLRTLAEAFGSRLAYANLYSEYPGHDETEQDDLRLTP